MKLKSLKIRNYRNLNKIDLDFKNINVFIGKNNAGKSNVLRAIDLFFNWFDSQDIEKNKDGSKEEFSNPYMKNITLKDYRLFFNKNNKKIELERSIELDS